MLGRIVKTFVSDNPRNRIMRFHASIAMLVRSRVRITKTNIDL